MTPTDIRINAAELGGLALGVLAGFGLAALDLTSVGNLLVQLGCLLVFALAVAWSARAGR